jgi:hypothetical protein
VTSHPDGTPAAATDAARRRYPGDRLMRIGAWTTAVGMVLTLVALLPLVAPSVHLPSAFWWLAMVSGVGLTLLLLGLWQAARARGRAVAHELDSVPPQP